MIRCFKCDTPATQGPDGVIHMGCNCFPPHLARHSVYPDGLQYCENCGTPMLQPDHTCRKVKPITLDALKPKQRDDLTPAMAERMDIMREDARIEAEAEYKQAMQKCIEHLKTCTTCKHLSQVDGSVCPDLRKLRMLRDIRLEEEVEVKV